MMHMIKLPLTRVLSFLVWGCTFSLAALASGKTRPPTATPSIDGKKVVALDAVPNVQIEMPDQSIHDFGPDFQASLITQLMQSGRYLVTDPAASAPAVAAQATSAAADYVWVGSVTPSATVRIEVVALNFSTGSLGEKMFYGFDETFHTPFNDGTGKRLNEFPLKAVSYEPSWFERSFDEEGFGPIGSRSGLDLGDGFSINALYAWLDVKYASYHSELHLKLSLDTPLAAATQYKWVEVKGDGFFFDVAGAYQGYSGGISIARRDAMDQALKNAIQGSFDAIDRSLKPLPMLAQVDSVLTDGTVLFGTGPFSDVQPGIQYEIVQNPGVVIQVTASNASGSVGIVVKGDVSQVKAGLALRQVSSVVNPAFNPRVQPNGMLAMANDGSNVSVMSASDTNQLTPINFPQSPELSKYAVFLTNAQAFAKSLAGAVFLPYRIARYFMYDQAYHDKPDFGFTQKFQASQEPWAKQIGLDVAPAMAAGSPVVAIIDSGVDYNHPALHGSIWTNPDGSGNPGWDFVSHDARPYDDGFHGTQVASVVVNVAPGTKIMPIKAFNPYGITSSAAIYSSFVYAVDHGAQIILAAWATRVPSDALEMGLQYAHDHGVVVVVPAGDQGSDLGIASIYPSVYSRALDNIVAVTGVDVNDQIVQTANNTGANYSAGAVQMAAPGQDIWVAEPRVGYTRKTSTGLAAAIVAGVLSRNLAAVPAEGIYVDQIQRLRNDAENISALNGSVAGGLRVKIAR
jgi:hypothetical protein